MKPAPFRYFAPESLGEALALLREHGDEAKVISGGQSLIPAMNLRLAKPAVLVDIKRIPGLSYIKEENGQILVGGLTTHADIELSELVKARCPLLHEGASHIGYPAIRNRGTIGGSIAHADPAATLPAVIAALNGTIVVTGEGGSRELKADEFFLSIFMTAMEPGEIVTEIRVPAAAPGEGHAWCELNRHTGDFALVGVAATVTIADGVIARACVALTGVGLRPVVPQPAIAALIGQEPSADSFARAGELTQAEIEPDSDIHATAEYRTAMVKVMVERTLSAACDRAQGGAANGGH